MELEGKAKMLRIYFGEDKWRGKPLYRAIVEQCRELDGAGATVYRGVEGYGASTLIHCAHLLPFSSDAPIMAAIVDNTRMRTPRLSEVWIAPELLINPGSWQSSHPCNHWQKFRINSRL